MVLQIFLAPRPLEPSACRQEPGKGSVGKDLTAVVAVADTGLVVDMDFDRKDCYTYPQYNISSLDVIVFVVEVSALVDI